MASERIPVCATYLVRNAAPHIASVIEHIRERPRDEWESILDGAFSAARSTISMDCVKHIMGPKVDEWTAESFAAATLLCNHAISHATRTHAIWDRRRTAKTIQPRLVAAADHYIRCWMRARGMDPDERGDS